MYRHLSDRAIVRVEQGRRHKELNNKKSLHSNLVQGFRTHRNLYLT
ncbi:hypothetical protein LX87_03733 [Larkinella arboricola]|uniref:Uncharacterized protein n=1 Tax=Larkinella arboricola TaxID=643671 RepID=A0A327WTZ5_LARAB|nr:hypothetical protein LX87_03733 [Larkinella arboricola]